MTGERRTQLGFGSPDAPEPVVTPEPSDPKAAAHLIAPRTAPHAETWSRYFFVISLKRAFRLHILNEEVLPAERSVLESQAAHITDPDQQAFLAWRRSVLLMIAIIFVPLTVSRFLETFDGMSVSPLARAFLMLPVVGEAAFCIVAFVQLKNWAQWRRQRRVLFIAWVLYFIAPFLVYLYPFREEHVNKAMLMGISFGLKRNQVQLGLGVLWGTMALLALAPKIISLMPGLIRASIVSKLLFPGTSAPGWLMMMAAPFYALFVFVIVLFPYQLTGSWTFVVGSTGILAAQVFIGSAGRKLTTPLTVDESTARIHKSWLAYIAILVVSAGFMVYGLRDVIRELNMGMVRVVTGVLAVVANVLLDTLIGTDAIVTAMAHFRRRGAPDPRDAELLAEAERKLGTFVT